MQTQCIRHGQIEVGIIEHNGREFSALGATTIGRHVTGYTKVVNGELHLSTWCGQTMIDCRSEVIQRFWSDTFAMMFRLTKGRFIVGYSLGDGMLFRGELITDSDEDDARRQALIIADYFAELDAEDEEAFALEQDH
jgi:hypothetical protein